MAEPDRGRVLGHRRKVIAPADFTSSDALAARLLAFQDRYNKAATPFGWKFSRADLDDLCRSIAGRQAASSLIAAWPAILG